MIKNIRIGGKTYSLSNSVGVFLRYKNVFGTSMLEDAKNADETVSMKLLYAMVTPSLVPTISFEDFVETIELGDLQNILDTVGELLSQAFPTKADNGKN